MSQEQSFSFRISMDPRSRPLGQRSGGSGQEDRFAFAPLREFHLGGGTVLARNAVNGRQMVLAGEVINALSHAGGFRTLEEHVAGLMDGSDGAPERAQAIRAILQSIRDGGLTLSAIERCRELAPLPPAPGPRPRTAAAIITCDRPAALERLLGSIAESCNLSALHRLHVVDDSRVPEHRHRNRLLVEDFTKRTSLQAVYVGADVARELVAALAARLPHLERPIRFLADRSRWTDFISTGVSRNLAQLLTVGRPLVVFDDDAVCRLYRPEFARDGIELSGGRRQAAFFDELEAQEARREADSDAIERLGRCLGLTLPGALYTLGAKRLDPRAWRHADAGFAARLHQQSRVLIAECGTLGDPGTEDDAWLGMLPTESVRRLASDGAQAERALRHGRCWYGVDRPTFTSSANFSQITGFDNGGYLPPYFPFGRGQDRVFGETVRFLFPDSVTLIHSWAALHFRVAGSEETAARQRRWNPEGFPGLLTFLPLERGSDCYAPDLTTRLTSLAAAFTDLGSCSPSTVVRLRAEQRLRGKSEYLEALSRSLELSEGGSPAWQEWLRSKHRETRAIMDCEPSLPDDHERLVTLWQSAWTEFGEGLRAWQEIRAAARELAAQD